MNSKGTQPCRLDVHHHILHPTDPPWGSVDGLDFPNALLESPFETTRAVANLLYNGVLTRFPDIRFVLLRTSPSRLVAFATFASLSTSPLWCASTRRIAAVPSSRASA